MAYEPNWLRGPEVYQLFDQQAEAQGWLARAVDDRGIVCDGRDDPSRDLFRLSKPIRWHAKRRWRASSADINWETFSIPAPIRRGSFQAVPIETSAAVLRGMVHRNPPQLHQRYAADPALVAEAKNGVRSGKWPNAYAAAKALAPRAEGQSQEAAIDRLYRKIRAANPETPRNIPNVR